MAFANTCEILLLLSKGRYFWEVVNLGTLRYVNCFFYIKRKLVTVLVNKLNLVSKCEMLGLLGVFSETTEVYNDIVKAVRPFPVSQ